MLSDQELPSGLSITAKRSASGDITAVVSDSALADSAVRIEPSRRMRGPPSPSSTRMRWISMTLVAPLAASTAAKVLPSEARRSEVGRKRLSSKRCSSAAERSSRRMLWSRNSASTRSPPGST